MYIDLSTLLIFFFSSAFVVQLFYFLFFFLRLSFHKNNIKEQNTAPISVIIAARNESENLKKFLPSVLNQEYSNFEVIVVNDRSWDNTEEILKSFQESYSHLKIVTLADLGKDNFSKKFAITLGIKAAAHEQLVFTDADCCVPSKKWLQAIAVNDLDGKEISLGAGPYLKQKGILNAIIRFDAAAIAIQYLSFAKAKFPYMGVGRNLSYKKSIYNSLQGFKSHYHIPSGDDDLFINQAANSKNTKIILSENSITFSIAENSIKNWIKQKTRHLQTSTLYTFKTKLLLILYPFTLFAFYISIPFLSSPYTNIILLGLLLRTLLQLFIFFKPLKIMGCKELIIFTPLLELILLFTYPILHLIKKTNKL